MARGQPFGVQYWIFATAICAALALPFTRASASSDGAPPARATVASAASKPSPAAGNVLPPLAPPSELVPLQRLLHESLVSNGEQDLHSEDALRTAPLMAARVRGVVVHVPDPAQSNLRLYYDQSLAALHAAAAADGYVQSAFELPWENSNPSSSTSPGFLLFKKQRGGAVDWLVAILVPESPVLGSSHGALDTALAAARYLSDANGNGLDVVGPFYSGTAVALRSALERATRPPLRPTAVAVTTGTATSATVDQVFEERQGLCRFERVVPTDDALVTWARAQLPAPPEAPVRLAWLQELGTAYGAQKHKHDAQSESDPVFRFPIHISDVRAEHDASTPSSKEVFLPLRRTLELKRDAASGPDSDTPRTLSPLTRYSDDLSLAQVLRAVCDSRSRYVIVQATDTVDVIFLSQQLRSYCRTTTVVTLGYDHLFTHPERVRAMNGALVASPYSPSLAISRTTEADVRQPFPSSNVQGLYNAFALAIGAADDKLIGLTCRPGSGSRGCSPSLFLSQVTMAGFAPLAADGVQTPQLFDEKPLTPSKVRLPSSAVSRAVAWPVLFLAIWHLRMRIHRREPFETVSRSWATIRAARLLVADLSLLLLVALVAAPIWAVYTRPGFEPKRWKAIAVELIAVSSLALVALLTLATVFSLGHAFVDWLRARRLVKSVGAARTSIPAGVLDGGKCIPFTPPTPVRRASRPKPLALPPGARLALYITSACTAVAALGLGGAAIAAFYECLSPLLTPPPEASLRTVVAFRWFRWFDPLAMSSALPFTLIAAGVYGWSLFALSRLGRLERFPKRLTKSLLMLPDLPGRELKLTCSELRFPWITTRDWGAPILAYVFCCWCFCTSLWPTAEGRAFDYGYSVAFCILLAFGTCELVRFVTLSGRLLRLLRDLAAEPMIDAYDRISRKVSGSFGLQLRARAPEPQDFQISVLTARTLTNLAPSPYQAALAAATDTLEGSMKALNAHPHRASTQRTVHTALFRIAGLLHAAVSRQWRDRANAPALSEAWADLSRKDLLPLGDHGRSPTALVLMGALPTESFIWLRAAEDFIALRTSTLIYQVLHELRQTLAFALGAGSLLAVSVASYPFQPARFLTVCGWSSVICVVGLGLWRMLSLERNEVLSRLGGTRPDHIEWSAGFIQQLALYVALPLGTAVLGLFPEVGERVAAILTPIAQLMPPGN